jgi:hypothetical protein
MASDPPPWSHEARSEDMVCGQLLESVPEVSLADAAAVPKDVKGARLHIKDQAQAIVEQIKNNPDAFVQHLLDTRSDLAGLPWRQGKDCRLTPESAMILDKLSLGVRAALDASVVFRAGQSKSSADQHPHAVYKEEGHFWMALNQWTKGTGMQALAVPVLHQMLMVENRLLRLSFVEHLGTMQDAGASVALARRAVFDLDADVRARAVVWLQKRPAKEYAHILTDALRYPWAPAAEHAAEALVALQMAEAVPQLVNLLGEPDPGTPFLWPVKGKQVLVQHEVVRVNHLRNCLLCHAPSTSEKDLVRGPVPTPGEALPSSATLYYYEERSGATLVRADITYLKQDFAVMQPVAKPGAWPTYQRYDYLVRVRALTFKELVAFEARQHTAKPQPLSAHQQAILFALRGLTGRDAGTSVRAWRKVLVAIRQEQLQSTD